VKTGLFEMSPNDISILQAVNKKIKNTNGIDGIVFIAVFCLLPA